MPKNCERCGEPNKRGGRLCSTCYQADYRSTPEGRQHVRSANSAYAKRHKDEPEWRAKRRETERNWRVAVGIQVPELQELRRAIGHLDEAIQIADERTRVFGPSKPDRDDGSEQRD